MFQQIGTCTSITYCVTQVQGEEIKVLPSTVEGFIENIMFFQGSLMMLDLNEVYKLEFCLLLATERVY